MTKLKSSRAFGKTGLIVPPIIYGTSYLGNLFFELSEGQKLDIVKQWFLCTEKPVLIDTAGKYGAGLALEMLGTLLNRAGIDPNDVIISNKLGWYRVPLTTPEPGFEPGAWVGLKHDAVQRISYKGILECWEQGNELMGGRYRAGLLSVHDPDEYLNSAKTMLDRNQKLQDIFDSYKALFE
jgi:D-threo-aldose 1-dehydrogenase